MCFLARVDQDRVVRDPRAVSRGNFEAVLVAARDAEVGGVMLHNHPSGVLEPSAADMDVAARLYERGLGTAIIDNDAREMYVVVEPPPPRVVEPLDGEALARVLGPEGPLAERHPGYEDRPAQRRMLDAVVRAYNDGGVALVEAGTGTGKSLAYLLPAARWAQANDERTVVSTNTINLQEQLVGKDLPLVRSLVGEVPWALVKGRGNYVSIRRARLAAEAQRSLFDTDRTGEIQALLSWLDETDDGSLADLTFEPSEEVWDEVRSDSDMCLRAECPHFQQCFYQNARRRAAEARILVVNHHLLFTDLAVRRASGNYQDGAVLPPYSRLILDEAHNVEDAATAHLGVEVTRMGLLRALGRLERKGRGILSALQREMRGVDGGREIRERVEDRVRPAQRRARQSTEIFWELVAELGRESPGPLRLGPSGGVEPLERPEVEEAYRAAVAHLEDLVRHLAELRARMELLPDPGEKGSARLLDLEAVERRLVGGVHALRTVLEPPRDGPPTVRWLEVRRRARRWNATLAAAPVEVADVLAGSLFGRLDTAVLTSATLATRDSFAFTRRRLGLDEDHLAELEVELEVQELILPSPFDFQEQAVLAVPTDLPPADGGGDASFHAETARITAELAEISGGGLFVLFTSYGALRQVAEALRTAGAATRWPLFVQGEDQRHRLLERFVAHGHGILLGTASFWEGVDVPGEPLRALVIQKLPFRVPTEPITEARMEAIARAGGDPFREFMLPHAALRLKQGFGRLIRSGGDRGAVLILDDRIVTKRYGRVLRDSLPPAPLVKGPWPEVRPRLEAFYRSRHREPPRTGR